jgi:phosphoserine aminotransferase
MKKYNFYAGPSILSPYAIEETAKAVKDFAGTGLSLLEISHRSKEFQAVMDEAQALVKELYDVPEGYDVVFLGGGASLQFCMVPYNLLKKKASYIDTGTWANKAIKEAKLFGEVEVVASSADKNYTYIPKGWKASADSDYFHYTSNNTIYGTETIETPDVPLRLVCDMSSDFMSHPVDISKYDLIYAGAQKNAGPAGVTVIIVKKDVLGQAPRPIPTMLNYETHVKKGSMFNTPPCLPVYTVLQTLKWYKELGGLKVLEQRAIERSSMLYDEIDRNKLFVGTAVPEDRSRMNVCFVMAPEYKDLEEEFAAYAKDCGMVGVKGHRSVGGFRASLYNAMPLEGVKALVACMQEFEKKH